MGAPLSPRLAAGALAVALGLGLHGAGFWLLRDRGPSRAALEAAARHVRDHHQPGDAIFLWPPWATEIRELLGDLEPLAVPAPRLEDLEAHPRVQVVSLSGREDGTGLHAAGHQREARERFSGVVVDRYRITGTAVPIWRALDALPTAKVFLERPSGQLERCDQWQVSGPSGRWVCPRDGAWMYIGGEYHRMGEHNRRCLWAHPPKEGRIVVRFPNVPLAGRVVGFGGHTLNASKRARAPVHLDVKVSGGEEQRFTFELSDTWRPFRLAAPAAGTATVSFAVSSPDDGANHFCFIADTRGAGQNP